MYPLVEQWETSSESKASFCRRHGLSEDTFRYWYKKYKLDQSKVPEEFVALTIKKSGRAVRGSGSSSTGAISISYPNGVKVLLNELVGAAYLLQLVKWEDHV